MNGSRAAVALGWRGKEAMEEYAKEIQTGGTMNDKLNDAMRWASMCENHAIATYINEMQCTESKRTGLWLTYQTRMAAGGLVFHLMELWITTL